MNEQLILLAEQAGIHPCNFEHDADLKVPLEKFAYLIIRKCCEISDEAEQADLPVVSSKFVKAYFGLDTQ